MNSRTPYSNGSNAGIILTGGIQASECTARSRSRASTTRQALAPDPTLVVSVLRGEDQSPVKDSARVAAVLGVLLVGITVSCVARRLGFLRDRKSTRLNSSHLGIS